MHDVLRRSSRISLSLAAGALLAGPLDARADERVVFSARTGSVQHGLLSVISQGGTPAPFAFAGGDPIDANNAVLSLRPDPQGDPETAVLSEADGSNPQTIEHVPADAFGIPAYPSGAPALARDRSRIAFPAPRVAVLPLAGDAPPTFLLSPTSDRVVHLAWSPDRSELFGVRLTPATALGQPRNDVIAITVATGAVRTVWAGPIPVDGTLSTAGSSTRVIGLSVSPDGTKLALALERFAFSPSSGTGVGGTQLQGTERTRSTDIAVIPAAGGGLSVIHTSGNERILDLDNGVTTELFAFPAPEPVLTDPQSGYDATPAWSPDGSEIAHPAITTTVVGDPGAEELAAQSAKVVTSPVTASSGRVLAERTAGPPWTTVSGVIWTKPGGLEPDNGCSEPPAGAGVVPAEGQSLACGAKVTSGACLEEAGSEVRLRQSEFWTASPNPDLPKAAGQNLAPEVMPLPETLAGPPASASPLLLGRRLADPGGDCNVTAGDEAQADGDALVLTRPGPHLMLIRETELEYAYAAEGTPSLTVCPGSLESTPPAGFEPADPDAGDGQTWQPVYLCVTREEVHFDVTHPAYTCSSLDGTGFPSTTGYINQYAIGPRVNLPSGGDDPRRGSNACGPSSLLMGMRAAKVAAGADPSRLDPILDVYWETMQKPPKDGSANVFVGGNATAYLQSHGWRQARLDTDLGNATQRQLQLIDSLARGPVVLSSAFGGGRWGRSASGHMILLQRLSADGRNVIVSDPAGDYFRSRTGHYGPSVCSRQVAYPLDWVVAFSSGRWLVELGAPGPDPTALVIRDVDRTAADAAGGFWLEDAQGRRAGWDGDASFAEIPGSQVAADQLWPTDPASEQDGPPDAAAPRTIVLAEPAADVVLRVRPGPGGFSLAARRWDGGATTGADQVSGPTGDLRTVVIPAVGLTPPGPAPPDLGGALPPAAAPSTPAAARAPNRRAPRLSSTVRRRGKRFVVTLRASDPSGIRRIEYRIAKRGKFLRYRRPLVLKRAQVRALRWRAVDRAGNVSRPAAVKMPRR